MKSLRLGNANEGYSQSMPVSQRGSSMSREHAG